jgi:hypothetical protein
VTVNCCYSITMAGKNDKPVVNFAVLQSVEDYVEKSDKFRTKCASFNIPGRDSGGASTAYIPYCEKQRFDFGHQLNEYRGYGVFKPPEIGKPWLIPDFIVFQAHFHDIHCPQPCRGYRNKRVVRLVAQFENIWSRILTTGKWTAEKISSHVGEALVLCVLGALLSGLLGWFTPEGRRLLHLDKPQPEQQTSSPSVPQTKPQANSVQPQPTKPLNGPAENHTTSDKVTAVVKPSSAVDWHDKHNWRKYLHTGMTRTDVQQIFGDPEKMRVYSTLEMWDYGSGSITFAVEADTPDGSLYSWDEPN